ncbi:6960_t:CDS:1, partial [Ambispora gerdemannii]
CTGWVAIVGEFVSEPLRRYDNKFSSRIFGVMLDDDEKLGDHNYLVAD